MYVSTLPLVLVGSIGFYTVPVMMIVCWALFGALRLLPDSFEAAYQTRTNMALIACKKKPCA